MIKTKNYRNAFAIAAILFSFALPCAAALAADDEIPLDKALELFYAHNYDILISRYDIDKASADLVGAKLLPNPTFSANYIGNEFNDFPRAGNNTQLTLRLEQLIELGNKRGLRTGAAQESLEAARLTHRDTIRTLLAGFYTLFYNLKLDLLNVDLAKDELQRFDRVLGIAEKRFSAGHLSLVDYTKIRVARIDLENSLTGLDTQLRNDAEQFSFLLGGDRRYLPLVVVRETFAAYGEQGLIAAARANRSDLLSLQKQLKASEYNGSLARAGRIPNITLGVEYDSFGRQNTPTAGFGFSLPLPLFNRNQDDILRRAAEHRQVELQIEKLERQIVVDVRQAVNNFESSLKVLDAYKRRKAEMAELLGRSEKAFSLGGITALDLLDTQKSHRDFMTRYNQALIQSNLNEALIKISCGEIQ